MKVNSTIQAIRERCPSFNGRVYGMASFALMTPDAVKGLKPEQLPACYVLCKDETAETEQRSENSYYQMITATVAIVCMVSNQSTNGTRISTDNRGQVAAERLEELKDEIFKALLSWSPTDDPLAIYSYDRFDVLRITPAVSVFELDLITTYEIEFNSTRQPDQLKENLGRFEKLDQQVIVKDDEDSEKQIKIHSQITDLW